MVVDIPIDWSQLVPDALMALGGEGMERGWMASRLVCSRAWVCSETVGREGACCQRGDDSVRDGCPAGDVAG